MRAESSRPVDWAEEMLRSLDEPMAKDEPIEVGTQPSAKVVNQAIADWVESGVGTQTDLIERIRVDQRTMHVWKTVGVTKPTKAFRRFCAVVSIDTGMAIKGKLKKLAADDRADDVLDSYLDAIRGTDLEPEFTLIAKRYAGFVKSPKR